MIKHTMTVTFPDMRISASRLRCNGGMASSISGSEFVRGLIDRYMRKQRLWPMVTLVFRHMGTSDKIYNNYQTHISPRLHFKVLHWHSETVTSPPQPLLYLTPRRETQTPLWFAEKLKISYTKRYRPDQITKHLIARSERIEVLHRTQHISSVEESYSNGLKDGAVSLSDSDVHPVEKILRRIEVETEPARSRKPGESSVTDLRQKSKEPHRAQQPIETSVDVSRLTEKVIREIDRQIIARRERMWR
jgi:hypothetical protein